MKRIFSLIAFVLIMASILTLSSCAFVSRLMGSDDGTSDQNQNDTGDTGNDQGGTSDGNDTTIKMSPRAPKSVFKGRN